MTKLSLMYVVSTHSHCVVLSEIGSGVGVQIQLSMPLDLMNSLVGRHVWVEGDWGDRCTIHSWPALPKPQEKTGEDIWK